MRGYFVFLVGVALISGCGRSGSSVVIVAPPPEPTIELVDGGTRLHITDPNYLQYLKAPPTSEAGWNAILAVRVGEGPNRPDVPCVAGTYTVEGGTLLFEPRYPFRRGTAYSVVYDPSRYFEAVPEGPFRMSFLIQKEAKGPPAAVAAVYPTRAVLPENQLKFYLFFSAPMSQGVAYEHIALLDAAGQPVAHPFLELREELWDPSSRRFTLFIDPGRIKRGLKPREEIGPSLEAGKSYTLVIRASWQDAEGNPLKEEFRKAFRVGPADETQPDPKTWKLQVPKAGSAAPLAVTFPEPLDRAMLERVVRVAEANGQAVEGTIEIAEEETLWRFTPKAPWTKGAYHLVADATLEDLAGNSIEKPFEVDEVHPIEQRTAVKTATVPFRVE